MQRRDADDRRHAETMRCLDDQSRALEAVVAGLETMTERTAPGPAG